MDDLKAIGICEGFIKCKDEEENIKAWQHLIDTGLAWTLQGTFGRMAKSLIEQEICIRK